MGWQNGTGGVIVLGVKFRNPIFALGIALFFHSNSAAYFSDENSPKSSRVMMGGGMRDPLGIGLEFQSKAAGNMFGSACLGFFPLDGFHGSLGGAYLWRGNKRFRPVTSVALSYLGGFGPSFGEVVLNGEESNFRVESGIFAHFGAGFQFRFWKGLGLQYQLGWRQTLTGGGYELISSTDPSVAEDVLDSMTGSGIMFQGRGFWEL